MAANGRGSRLSHMHPNLYKALVVYSCLSLALGLNFIFLHPAFAKAVPPKGPEGVVFLTLGLAQLALLTFTRQLKAVRAVMAAISTMLVYHGAVLVVAYFQLHQTSLQLPITYFGLAVLGLISLVEPFSNPLTGKNGSGIKNGMDSR